MVFQLRRAAQLDIDTMWSYIIFKCIVSLLTLQTTHFNKCFNFLTYLVFM